MPEHKVNDRALTNATFPPVVKPGQKFGTRVMTSRRPADGILLLPAAFIEASVRKSDSGALELKDANTGEWAPAPPNLREVWELGKPLPPEKVVLQFRLVSVVEEKISNLVALRGSDVPQMREIVQTVAILAEVNLAAWQKGNELPEESAPGN